MQKSSLLHTIITLVVFCIVTCHEKIGAQVVIGAPDLQFSMACANASFNTFETSFVFSPENGINSDNQFIVEMSNSEGDFTNAEIVFTSNPGAISSAPATVAFSLPIETTGEAYKIRIKSTSPEAVSAASQSFAAYYKIQDSPFTINNLMANAAICNGGSYLLTIDNPGNDDNDSPLQYPSLNYNWFKELDPTTFVLVGEDPTLTVSEEGVYFVETDYGSCTSNSFSNRVTISEVSSGQGADTFIASSLGNPFCVEEGSTTLSTVSGNSYEWYRDGNILPNETSQNVVTNLSGFYEVVVSYGNCEVYGSVDLLTGDFNSSIDVPLNNFLENGEILNVTVTTNAANPAFTWMLNDEEIPNESQASLNATEFGAYRVLIQQTLGCVTTKELVFNIEEFIDLFPEVAEIPNVVSPNGDGINDTWIIPTQYVSGTETEIQIVTSHGEVVVNTNSYANNWPEDQMGNNTNEIFYYIIKPLDEAPKMGSITLIK